MKSVEFRSRILVVVAISFMLVALQGQLAAQHTQYKLIDLGTFGGPASIIAPTDFGGPENPGRGLTNTGVIVGAAETTLPDPFAPNYCGAPCLVVHAFVWKDGALTDLGTTQGGSESDLSSVAHWINDRGWIAGFSQIGGFDSQSGNPSNHPTLWRNGNITDLGTLGGDFGGATAVNNRGQVVGFSTNGKSDPVFGGVQTRAFIWESGVMHELGTLCEFDGICGTYAQAFAVNERGQVAGISSTNTTPNATTGAPTIHPFIWERGKMIDLGTLGGTLSAVDGPALVMNNRGQVAGTSELAGDTTYHPYFWDHGVMTDVGTLGGDTGFVTWINDAGAIIGTADLPGPSGSQSHHAFLWRNGVMTDLGTLGATSHAEGINSAGQIVGRSKVTPDAAVQHAFLWEKGGPMVDLNTLIPQNSPLQLEEGGNINDRGEIAGRGVPPDCDDVDACGHAFLLIPCSSDATCESSGSLTTAMSQQTSLTRPRSIGSVRTPSQILNAWQARLARRRTAP
jgi:probable HAF family extracellular repeat protein